MAATETRLRDASGLALLVEDLARQIAQGRDPAVPLRLVGVRTRGVPIAERLAQALKLRFGVEDCPVGAVDITLYRDDLGRGDRWPVLRGTEVPFGVEGAEVVLVDDVLFTGRTVRAALNSICDLGRPARVRLAVLVDRGGRELPICADYVGLEVTTGPTDRVQVKIAPIDPEDEVLRSASDPE